MLPSPYFTCTHDYTILRVTGPLRGETGHLSLPRFRLYLSNRIHIWQVLQQQSDMSALFNSSP